MQRRGMTLWRTCMCCCRCHRSPMQLRRHSRGACALHVLLLLRLCQRPRTAGSKWGARAAGAVFVAHRPPAAPGMYVSLHRLPLLPGTSQLRRGACLGRSCCGRWCWVCSSSGSTGDALSTGVSSAVRSSSVQVVAAACWRNGWLGGGRSALLAVGPALGDDRGRPAGDGWHLLLRLCLAAGRGRRGRHDVARDHHRCRQIAVAAALLLLLLVDGQHLVLRLLRETLERQVGGLVEVAGQQRVLLLLLLRQVRLAV